MNGQKSNDISRRNFIVLISSAIVLCVFYVGHFFKRNTKNYKITDHSPDFKSGHRLRGAIDRKPEETIITQVLIVGAGISGLSAARKLHIDGISDFKIIDLESRAGGNSSGYKNNEFSFPSGAHYLTIPNNENIALINFLKEIELVDDKDGVLKYESQSLVHYPEERNYYQGKWHKGLIPEDYYSEEAKSDYKKFQLLIKEWKANSRLTIPLKNSILTNELLALDEIIFEDYLRSKFINSDEFLIFLDYCCRDDYGAGIKKVSALAGIVYFSARKSEHFDSSFSEYLTWNNGNQYLVDKFQKYTEGKSIFNSLVYQVSNNNGSFETLLLNEFNQVIQINSKTVILAIPYYISERIVRDNRFKIPASISKEYYPWIIINFILKPVKENGKVPTCWDNIFYGSNSLGYINSSHQELSKNLNRQIFTYYKTFSNSGAIEEREKLMKSTNEDLVKIAINEMTKVYEDFESHILEVYICKRGHGMITPVPGVISGLYLNDSISTGVDGMYYAHSDASGFSVFEEAFNNGYLSASRTSQFLNR